MKEYLTVLQSAQAFPSKTIPFIRNFQDHHIKWAISWIVYQLDWVKQWEAILRSNIETKQHYISFLYNVIFPLGSQLSNTNSFSKSACIFEEKKSSSCLCVHMHKFVNVVCLLFIRNKTHFIGWIRKYKDYIIHRNTRSDKKGKNKMLEEMTSTKEEKNEQEYKGKSPW